MATVEVVSAAAVIPEKDTTPREAIVKSQEMEAPPCATETGKVTEEPKEEVAANVTIEKPAVVEDVENKEVETEAGVVAVEEAKAETTEEKETEKVEEKEGKETEKVEEKEEKETEKVEEKEAKEPETVVGETKETTEPFEAPTIVQETKSGEKKPAAEEEEVSTETPTEKTEE